MFQKLSDLLREVFWLKKSGPKKRRVISRRKAAQKKKPAPTKRPAPKKAVKPAVKALKPPKLSKKHAIDPNLSRVGEITHYFDRIKVGVVKITQGTILIGDRLTIAANPAKTGPRGSGPFVQKVWSMQIESQDVKVAKKGQLIGIKIDKPAAVGDVVYK